MTTADELLTLTTGTAGGVAFVPQPASLSRLNYFDGKFLRAADLAGEAAGDGVHARAQDVADDEKQQQTRPHHPLEVRLVFGGLF